MSMSTRNSATREAGDVSELAPSPPEPREYDCWVAHEPAADPGHGDPDGFVVDIVLVHGITGSQTSTWTTRNKKGEAVLWPRDILTANDQIPRSRIIFFGYDADVVNFWAEASQNCLGEHADSLMGGLGMLRRKTNTMNRPIFFVTHSMGGLVVKEGLTKSRDSIQLHVENIYKMTFGIAFLGTPHRGADLAYWAELAGKFLRAVKRTNLPLLTVLKPRSETLGGIQRRFHDMVAKRRDDTYRQQQRLPYPFKIHCFAEELALKGVGRVVEPDSARLDEWPCDTIHANHMGMTRFPDEDAPGFKNVSGVLWGWVEDLKALVRAGTDAVAVGHTSSSRHPLSPNLLNGLLSTQPHLQLPSQQRNPIQEQEFEAHNTSRPLASNNSAPQSAGSGEGTKTRQKKKKEKKAPGGAKFTFNKNKGNFAVADTFNIRSGASVFAASSPAAESDDAEEESSDE